jgi:hypothetical protein
LEFEEINKRGRKKETIPYCVSSTDSKNNQMQRDAKMRRPTWLFLRIRKIQSTRIRSDIAPRIPFCIRVSRNWLCAL